MKRVRDHYFKRARLEGYAARSVYKLKEIDEKYRLLKEEFTVLDIGCAPGSWSQYILERIERGRLIGIDLENCLQIEDPRFSFIRGDILDIDPVTLLSEAPSWDLILSDAAPNTTGNKFTDSQKSLALVERVAELASRLLKPGGSFVAKVFQGEDIGSFLNSLKPLYKRIVSYKPRSSRSESKELYIIALGKK